MALLAHDHAHGKGAAHAGHHQDAAAPVHSCCGGKHGEGEKPAAAGLVKDPVCGMSVDPATAKHHSSYLGQDYFFCSARCRERFEAEPAEFPSPGESRPAPPAPSARAAAGNST